MKDFLIIFNDESKKELGDYIVQLDRMWAKTIENCLDIMDRITFLPPTVFSALQKLQTMREEQKKAELEAKRTEQKLRIVCEEKRQLRDRIANILDQEVPSLDALRYATASFFKRLWDISNERDKCKLSFSSYKCSVAFGGVNAEPR
jgi:GTP1/Obg family GTP-binding protein